MIDDLDAIYQNYIDVDFIYGSESDHKPKILHRGENNRVNQKPKNFFRNSIADNSNKYEHEMNKTNIGKAALRHRSFSGKENMRDVRAPRERAHKGYTDLQSDRSKNDYSYNSLINALEMKVKSEVSIVQTENIKRQITRSTDLKVKMNSVFSEHSRWLRDVKEQVTFYSFTKY